MGINCSALNLILKKGGPRIFFCFRQSTFFSIATLLVTCAKNPVSKITLKKGSRFLVFKVLHYI